MNSINEILRDYTAGGKTLEDTNAALAEAEAGFRLEPGRNEITEEDRRNTTVGYYPEQADGVGLLFTGTGTPDKVGVYHGRLEYAVNEVQSDGAVNSFAQVMICGKVYDVRGDALAEPAPAQEIPDVQKDVDMRRRTDLAGTTQEQRCRKGRFAVTYDEDGYAVKARRLAPHEAAGSAEARSSGPRL